MGSIGTVGFPGSGGSESAGIAYSILVNYGNGTSQTMPPFIMFPAPLLNYLAVSGISYSWLNNVITSALIIDDKVYTPDYQFHSYSPGSEEYNWWNANKNQFGAAFLVVEDKVFYATQQGYQVFFISDL